MAGNQPHNPLMDITLMNQAADTKAHSEVATSNAAFLAGLISALVALVLSATVLVLSYPTLATAYQPYRDHAPEKDASPFVIQGGDLIVRLGAGGITKDKSMMLTRLAEVDNERRAIATRPISLTASDYPFVQYDISNRNKAEFIYLIWRTKDQPEETFYSPLHSNEYGSYTAFPGQNENWKGQITEIGVDVYGELRGKPLAINRLTLLPPSTTDFARSIWTEWTAYNLWKQSSAHTLPGTPSADNILSPTLAAAAWSGLALIFLAIARLATSASNLVAFAAVLFIPWLSVDLLWQSDLSGRLQETKQLFSGKSQHERQLADREHALYRYAQHLKNQVLPEPGIKIHLLDNAAVRTYERLKVQYYLFPYNTYNFDRYPRPEYVRPGDYILILDPPADLVFSAEQNALQWQGHTLPATLVDQQPEGSLYLVTGAAQ